MSNRSQQRYNDRDQDQHRSILGRHIHESYRGGLHDLALRRKEPTKPQHGLRRYQEDIINQPAPNIEVGTLMNCSVLKSPFLATSLNVIGALAR